MTPPLLPISLALCIGLATYFGWAWTSGDRAAYLPGETTHGHYQIELACNSCHEPWGGATQEACEGCHLEELEMADDSHPKSKFTDPRNADRVAKLDARECVTCHAEHRPELTSTMGLTQPEDYCYMCHSDIAEERESHEGLGFETCASAGCHNFHDNLGLNEDFLEQHLREPPILEDPRLLSARVPPDDRAKTIAPATVPDAPASVETDPHVMQNWLASAHAAADVNCTDCHELEVAGSTAPRWVDDPGHEACRPCHEDNVAGFLAGRHGMRLAEGLSPMRPEMARLPMRDGAHGRQLGCSSCHGAHRYDATEATTDACLDCHADEHSLAYRGSPHDQLAQRERRGQTPPGSGVTCATCHLPETQLPGRERAIQHNQNANLRPNEKMIRDVCTHCHGVGFSIDALADAELVRRNFAGKPSKHIESVDWVIDKLQRVEASNAP